MVTAMAEARGDTRERIQQVALELFTQHGYEKTSLREIADRLNVSTAALYYHFKTKADILSSVVDDLASSVEEVAEWGQAQPTTLDMRKGLLERLSQLVSSGKMRNLMLFSQENQAALREHPAGQRLQQGVQSMFALVIDPQADFADQLRAQLAVLAILLSNNDALSLLSEEAMPEGVRIAPEQRAEVTLKVAMELITQPGNGA
ncbi:hypothetical protein SMF913_26380 [Streptomyces malaysiensis]|uniref:HTH tetR-type domain-containing protein n=2 Tax=Streptomyces malaysiensis TaxID=92644 RepID=A0A2J7YSA8_STRMQ|nr:hypothetical protein SMF913_26380 [Streptomyces malaysiensis]